MTILNELTVYINIKIGVHIIVIKTKTNHLAHEYHAVAHFYKRVVHYEADIHYLL